MLISIQENANKLLSNSVDIEFQMSASVNISGRGPRASGSEMLQIAADSFLRTSYVTHANLEPA